MEENGLTIKRLIEGGCPACGLSFGDCGRPHVRVPVQECSQQLWHLRCFFAERCRDKDLLEAIQRPVKRRALEVTEGADFEQQLRELANLCPDLCHESHPGVRVCGEELHLMQAAKGIWPPVRIAEVPSVIYAFEGVIDFRVSACAAFWKVQPQIAQVRGLKSLVFISCSLRELPDEVGELEHLELLFVNGNFLQSLPESVCKLPRLTHMCLDSNLITHIAPITSPHLELLTAPGNLLECVPEVCPGCTRLEFHGNKISEFKLTRTHWPKLEANWGAILSLKLMGNRLRELPPEIGIMHLLRILLVANNFLRALPEGVVNLKHLEWLYAYDNAVSELPKCLLKSCTTLDRILLEGNPLSASALQDLLADAPCSRVRTLGLDFSQLSAHFSDNSVTLPASVKIGSLVGIGGPCEHYYMKLVPWSQLHRAVTDPQPAIFSCREEHAQCLVVAFSASQAEPEWLGLLSRMARSGHCELDGLYALKNTLDSFLQDRGMSTLDNAVSYSQREACLAAFWSGCASSVDDASNIRALPQPCGNLPLTFDILSLVDHRMSWYAADANNLANALWNVTKAYKHVVFVGASMGGVGAILHGGRLADAVVAFGPQGSLLDAILRPQARNTAALQALTSDLHDSVRHARQRAASVQVHCAADNNFLQTLQLPLEEFAVTVHPICPRKPFARFLDKCNMMTPIIYEALIRVLKLAPLGFRQPPMPFTNLAAQGGLLEASSSETNVCLEPEKAALGKVAVACWNRSGGFTRYSATADQMLRLFFAYPAPDIPCPGHWYCPVCKFRNKNTRFFCKFCIGVKEANVWLGIKVPDGNFYPRPGDWGCGKCGEALCAFSKSCTRCWTSRWDDCNYTVPGRNPYSGEWVG